MWFLGIGIYVMCLGGVFYYNLFKWTFDEKLKTEIIDKIKMYAPPLSKGLMGNSRVMTFPEYDVMQALIKDERIASVLYLSRSGTVRWHKDTRFIGKSWDEFQKAIPPATDAITQAYFSKHPKVRPVPNESFYEIAIPFTARTEIIGIISVLVSKAPADVLVGSAMRKYVFGALGVLFLLGLPLYFFLHHYVVSPMEALQDNVDNISLKTFDLRFPPRSDEIGGLVGAISRLLGKMKLEIEGIVNRDRKYKEAEQKWWRSLLNTIVPGEQYVIVVDENNNILYANFELAGGGEAKNIHLLDVVDSQQQNLLRLVGQAFETPNRIVEGETVFRNQNLGVKVLHVGDTSEMSRTLILLHPKSGINI